MSLQDQIEKQVAEQLALEQGADRPKGLTLAERKTELDTAVATYKSAPTNANRGRMNLAFALLRDARAQAGRFSALWLSESNALRAIYSQGLTEARIE